jgi:hypothetical protein
MRPFVVTSFRALFLGNKSSRIQLRRSTPSLWAFLLLFCVGVGDAQVGQAPGIQMFSTRSFNIDLATSSITTDLPIRSKLGKIPVSYSLIGNYQIYAGTSSQLNYNLSGGPMAGQITAHTFGYGLNYTATTILSCNGGSIEGYGHWMLYDTSGTAHPLSFEGYVDAEGTCYTFPASTTTADGSGLTVTSNSKGLHSSFTVYDKAGYAYGGATLTDPDGATITESGTGTVTVTDSLASTFMTETFSGNYLSSLAYPGASGSNISPPFKIAYQSFNLKSNFNCSGLGYNYADYSYAAISLPISITDPTGAVTTIGYENTPGNSGYTTGRLASITYGTGGSISYAYGQNGDAQGQNGFDCVSFVVPLITVTVSDNNGNTNKWTYANYNRGSTAGNFTVVQTDPANNQTAYNFYAWIRRENSP